MYYCYYCYYCYYYIVYNMYTTVLYMATRDDVCLYVISIRCHHEAGSDRSAKLNKLRSMFRRPLQSPCMCCRPLHGPCISPCTQGGNIGEKMKNLDIALILAKTFFAKFSQIRQYIPCKQKAQRSS